MRIHSGGSGNTPPVSPSQGSDGGDTSPPYVIPYNGAGGRVLLHKELIQVEAQLDLVVLEQLQLSQDLQQLTLVEVEVVVMQVQHQVQLHQIQDLVELVVAEMELLAL